MTDHAPRDSFFIPAIILTIALIAAMAVAFDPAADSAQCRADVTVQP